MSGKGVVRIWPFGLDNGSLLLPRNLLCSLAIQRELTLPVSLREGGITAWIPNDKEPGTHDIGKVDIFNCIIQSSLSCIIPSISCPLFLLMVIINMISSKLVSGMMELEGFILSFLENFRNWITNWVMTRSRRNGKSLDLRKAWIQVSTLSLNLS